MSHYQGRIAIVLALGFFGFAGFAAADQIDQFCTEVSGNKQIQAGMPIGQEFVPSAGLHVGLDLRISIMNDGFPSAPVTIQLRAGTIDGPVIFGSTVTLVPGVVEPGYAGAWVPFTFASPLSLSVGATYVVEVSTTTPRWGWVGFNSECYTGGGSYINGNWGYSDRGFRTWVSSPYIISAELNCVPSSGTLPFITSIKATLGHGDYNRYRRIAGRLNVTIASGSSFSSWRAGFTNTTAADPFVIQWLQNIPAAGTLMGDNIFTLVAEDVTPAPYNQPPYPPSADTATASCTVTGIAP